MLAATVAPAFMVLLTVMIHCEGLQLISRALVRITLAGYTSLGPGDVYPLGDIRILTGIESLNGLVLIGWSASYSYLVVERLWGFPGDRGNRSRLD